MKRILFCVCAGYLLAGCCPTAPTAGEWKNEAPGVWTTIVGTPESYDLLSSTGTAPRLEALSLKSEKAFPLNTLRVKTKVVDGKTYLTFPLTPDEQIYGLGLQFKSVGRRGQIMRLHMDHYGSQDNGRTHAPVPFFVSSKGYGVLINSARYIDVWVGTGVRTDSPTPLPALDRNTDPAWNPQPYSDNLEILIPAQGVELVLFSGENMLDVVSRFNLWCGGGSFDLYDDDGRTYDFEKGEYTIKRFTASPDGTHSVKDMVSAGGWTYGPVTWRKMGNAK